MEVDRIGTMRMEVIFLVLGRVVVVVVVVLEETLSLCGLTILVVVATLVATPTPALVVAA